MGGYIILVIIPSARTFDPFTLASRERIQYVSVRLVYKIILYVSGIILPLQYNDG